ncbi:MAG: uroporphyrinogen-III C-methyltransferase [Bacillota bacterium]
MSKGKVLLVGAGPGDSKLITVKGQEAIAKADLIVYDYLANSNLLNQASADAEKLYVGKKAGDHTYTQAEINQLLVQKAAAGKVVTRLKGGDPFIFGRGGEEAAYLQEHGIEFEVVPGITSPIGAAAYAGIPLTHRDFNSTVAFATGHQAATKEESSINWDKLATATGTIVFLMGVGNLERIVAKLQKHGRASSTPVALVRWGTKPEQETVSGTLDNIVQRVRAADLQPPAIIIVGEVVNLRDQLQWFDNQPLFGQRILVTRPKEQASSLSNQLAELGAEPIESPAIKIAPPKDFEPLDKALQEAGEYDWVIFTSVNGVKSVVKRLRKLELDVRAFGNAKIGAIGSKTAAEIEDWGLKVDYIPKDYVSESILAGLDDDLSGEKFLLPRSDISRPTLPQGLVERGAEVNQVTAYRILPGEGNQLVADLVADGKLDLLTFTSSSTVRNFIEMLDEPNYQELLAEVSTACIGPITAQTAQDLGLNVDIVAEEYTIEGLVRAILEETGRKADD